MKIALGILCGCVVFAQPAVVFLEPLQKIETNAAEVRAERPAYRVVDGARYLPWLHAAVGFRVGAEDHSRQAYILLDPDPRSFEMTILHETGHVAMHMLSGGEELLAADVCSIPHTTAALSDRLTAFSEGWAIHLETLGAHLASSPGLRKIYRRTGVQFGEGPYREMEYFRPAADVATYAQNLARYYEVREDSYAFQSAYKGPDYLRAQLEKARDFASLRDANQLLQSEGFYASFFFLFTIRGAELLTESAAAAREQRMLQAMQAMFAKVKPEPDTPWLIHFVRAYIDTFPEERGEIVQALNDVSRGVFVDAEAAALWRAHYMAALKLDLEALNRDAILKKRRDWNERAARDPGILFTRLGPQIPCTVPAVSIKVEAFGEAQALLFDVNTAEEGGASRGAVDERRFAEALHRRADAASVRKPRGF